MRARTYGLLLLALVGVLPLLGFGYLAVDRAERTAMVEVQTGNRELARSVAHRIAAFAAAERELLRSIGAAIALAPDREAADANLNAYGLTYQRFRNLAVFDDTGEVVAGEASEHAAPLAGRALDDARAVHSQARPAGEVDGEAFSHAFSIAVPIVVAGAREGVIVADVDLTGVWRPVDDILIGETGFARLLSTDGQLLAHGNPDERRFVFDGETEKNSDIAAGALLGEVVQDRRGEAVVATPAFVPGLPWLVVIEQQVSEAFAPAQALARSLWVWTGFAAAVAVGVGLVFGRTIVRPLEKLRAHTLRLGEGDLQARVDPGAHLVEARALGDALNDMAASLQRLQEEAKRRDRLATFSRVAAGLAHDLRQPIEAVRAACDTLVNNPREEGAIALVEAVNRRDLPRLKRYMDDLHRLARTGEMSLEVEPIAPRELVDRVVESLSASPKWSGVEFVAAGEAPAIRADPRLIERAVTNLAANGADACMAAGPRGKVSVEVGEAGADGVAIRVVDAGRGIEPERLDQLFYADFTSTKRASGVGLGLGVVRQVAETHEGSLEVESELGEGSTFTLWIPRVPPTEAARAAIGLKTDRRSGRPMTPESGRTARSSEPPAR